MGKKGRIPEISVVVPVFNEELVIEKCIWRILEILDTLNQSYELVFVDDGSSDKTVKRVLAVKEGESNIRLISLPRNLGHMYALSVGLSVARGRFVITIDADLQDPPEAIAELYHKAVSNSELQVVQTIRVNRRADTFFKRTTANLYYKIMSSLSGLPITPNAADYRLLTREAVDFLNGLPEINKIYRLLIPHFGFNTAFEEIVRNERIAGESKYSFKKMLSLSMDSLLEFSSIPLKLLTRFGLYLSVICLVGATSSIVTWAIARDVVIPGWTSTVLAILFGNSIVLMGLGLIGQYVARIYSQVLNRPRVFWKEF